MNTKKKEGATGKKVTREEIPTDFDWLNPKTLSFRSRLYSTSYSKERDSVINPSSKYFKSEVARTLKKAGIEFAILEKKIYLSGLGSSYSNYQYKLMAEEENSEDGFTSLPVPDSEDLNAIPLSFTNFLRSWRIKSL